MREVRVTLEDKSENSSKTEETEERIDAEIEVEIISEGDTVTEETTEIMIDAETTE